MHRKRYPLFFALLVLTAFLMMYQGRSGPLRPLGFLSGYLSLASEGASTAGDSARGVLRRFRNRDGEVKGLVDEVRALRLKEQGFKEIMLENKRLRDVLCLKDRQGGLVTAAKVISKSPDRWANAVVIDKGRSDFVEKGMAVVTAEGLAGKVQEAHGFSSTVLLVDDMQFRAAVRLQDSRGEAVLSGAGTGRALLKYVGAEMAAKPGEIVITSGMDGLFPPGLVVGYVSGISGKEGFFHEVAVDLFVDTRKVEEVVVVRK